ncbi:Protein of unknown function [Pseudomonas delhiensis]|uniref:DUF1654 domain-containing protein n=1 Tax=Pseudomonas delhiensis TaxID=366289 RepID=A0A239I292_9PSED|nr:MULTISPECIES: DUF1654 domain-containing protein [Pseudomonas]MED5611052.1 DUF1654 domain-containing protein [Pseudomonas sp. JH-2]PWU29696.1 DUF1654 domain-containing protein [Pseudomonas sp. RW407]SDJ60600.1 Protein of unknown function [Pseudomonas delhiensis]SNS87707.1 Protein of unknown function [Pseudomonas delhiensis]
MHADTYQQLAARVNAQIAAHDARQRPGLTLQRVPGDDAKAWERVLTELRGTDNLTVLPLRDGAVRLAWHSWLD